MNTESFSESSPTTPSALDVSEANWTEDTKSEDLYVTRLVSLFLFRLIHDDNVEEFHLDGDMIEDISFTIKFKEREKPTIIFLHISHFRDPFTEHARTSILNYMFDLDYVSIDWLLNEYLERYGGNFEEIDYLRVVYTNANVSTIGTKRKPFHSGYAEQLNTLIATGGENRQGVHIDLPADKVEERYEQNIENEMINLAQLFVDLLGDQSMHIMQYEFILLYHLILSQKVVHVSDIKTKGSVEYRELTFRPDFIATEDKYLKILRDMLYKEFMFAQQDTPKKNSIPSFDDCEDIIGEEVSAFLSHPSVTTLTPLIEKGVIRGSHKIYFNVERPSNDLQKLELINTSQHDIRNMMKEAKSIAGRNLLKSLKFEVSANFGNKDLVLTRKSVKRNRRLKFLASSIVELCQTSIASGEYNIVTIDESDGGGFLSVEAGIGSAIGNLFIYDEATKLLKFTENVESLQDNARALHDKLKSSGIGDTLNSYRFDAKSIKHFPKLELDSIEDIKEVINKRIVLYEKQDNHNEIEKMLKEEIKRKFKDEVLSDKIFMYCHSAVQEWWMSEENINRCLTKSSYI